MRFWSLLGVLFCLLCLATIFWLPPPTNDLNAVLGFLALLGLTGLGLGLLLVPVKFFCDWLDE